MPSDCKASAFSASTRPGLGGDAAPKRGGDPCRPGAGTMFLQVHARAGRYQFSRSRQHAQSNGPARHGRVAIRSSSGQTPASRESGVRVRKLVRGDPRSAMNLDRSRQRVRRTSADSCSACCLASQSSLPCRFPLCRLDRRCLHQRGHFAARPARASDPACSGDAPAGRSACRSPGIPTRCEASGRGRWGSRSKPATSVPAA